MRIRAGMLSGAVRATVIAYTTIVRMPERWSRSAMIQTPKVPTNCTITAVATSSILVIHTVARARTRPSTTLPTVTTSSIGRTPQPEMAPAAVALTASR